LNELPTSNPTAADGPPEADVLTSGCRRRHRRGCRGCHRCGIATTGVSLAYFFQPTGVLILVGGTLGVTLVTTPTALVYSVRRVIDLFWAPHLNREELIEEIVSYTRLIRLKGLYALEPLEGRVSNPFLAESLLLARDVKERSELQSALENKIRLKERQGEADTTILEVAGGFAPTIGVLGTVVGLINV
jgi:chemotaxis protein MotA